MKYILIASLVLFNCQSVSAQRPKSLSQQKSKKATEIPFSKHVIYTDVGISFSKGYPGLSATYNYRLARWFGVGVGVQGYFFYPTMTNDHEFIPAVFADLRFNIRARKKGQLFIFLDLGADFYKHTDKFALYENKIHSVPGDNGFYTGLAIGYFRALTKHGGGPYGSLKLITNGYNTNSYDLSTQEEYKGAWIWGTGAVSVGFRF